MKEKSRKINAFDIVFILIILAAAVVLIIYFMNKSKSTDNELGDKVTYVIEIVATDQEVADAINVGDNITDSTTKSSLGTVIAKEYKEAESINFDYNEKRYILEKYPDKIAVRMTVEADITESKDEISVGGSVPIRVSYSFGIRGPGYTTYGSVVEIVRGAVE